MTLQSQRLYFITSHLPGVIERMVILLSTLLTLIPLLSMLRSYGIRIFRKTSKYTLGILLYLIQVEITTATVKIPILETYDTSISPNWIEFSVPPHDSQPLDSIDTDSIETYNIGTDTVRPDALDVGVCFFPDSPSSLVAGLKNIGNSCFLNSVLQSLSSLPKFHAYLNQVNPDYSEDQILPLTRSLLKTLQLLSIPADGVVQTTDVVAALTTNNHIINGEQQDAQELYQLLMDALGNELENNDNMAENPVNGLFGYRITCTKCEYSSGYNLQSFNNVQLTLPRTTSTTLDECFLMITSAETLEGVECSNCTLVDSLSAFNNKIQSSTHQPEDAQGLAILQALKQDIERRLRSGQIELDEKLDINFKKLLKISKGHKTNKCMFESPPKVLCLHFVRHIVEFTGEVIKNTCRVDFPEVLDLSPFCINDTVNTQAISLQPKLNTSITFKYRLMSIVVHFGGHDSGHYIAYKRRLYTEQCHCNLCSQGKGTFTELKPHDADWFRTSDDSVVPCKIEDVLAEKYPFMLMYELIDEGDN